MFSRRGKLNRGMAFVARTESGVNVSIFLVFIARRAGADARRTFSTGMSEAFRAVDWHEPTHGGTCGGVITGTTSAQTPASWQREWQWMFPWREVANNPTTGVARRRHVLDGTFQNDRGTIRAVDEAGHASRVASLVCDAPFREWGGYPDRFRPVAASWHAAAIRRTELEAAKRLMGALKLASG